jgi:DNA end-binding protein Ku
MTIRSTWTGKLTVGFLSFGIRVHSATEESGRNMHDAHIACGGGRTGLRRHCKDCGQQDLESWEIGKTTEVEVDDEHTVTVLLDSGDLRELRPHIAHEATVIEFVEPHTIPVELYGSFYYLSPDKPESKRSRNSAERAYNDDKAYAVLAEGLRRTGRVAVVRIALRQKESLAVVYPQDGMLCLRTLLWADQIRWPDIDNLPIGLEFSDRELTATEALIEAMSGKFDPTAADYANTYVQRLDAMIEEKVA